MSDDDGGPPESIEAAACDDEPPGSMEIASCKWWRRSQPIASAQGSQENGWRETAAAAGVFAERGGFALATDVGPCQCGHGNGNAIGLTAIQARSTAAQLADAAVEFHDSTVSSAATSGNHGRGALLTVDGGGGLDPCRARATNRIENSELGATTALSEATGVRTGATSTDMSEKAVSAIRAALAGVLVDSCNAGFNYNVAMAPAGKPCGDHDASEKAASGSPARAFSGEDLAGLSRRSGRGDLDASETAASGSPSRALSGDDLAGLSRRSGRGRSFAVGSAWSETTMRMDVSSVGDGRSGRLFSQSTVATMSYAGANSPASSSFVDIGRGSVFGTTARSSMVSLLTDTQKQSETGEPAENPGNTVMFYNLPEGISRTVLEQLLDREGFGRSYDFVYLPAQFATGFAFGYAFINIVSDSEAMRFRQHFQDFTRWPYLSNKQGTVQTSETLQGLDALVERYRNSPLMHPSVPDEMRPAVYSDGVRACFPPPTVVLRPPRVRASKRSGGAAST